MKRSIYIQYAIVFIALLITIVLRAHATPQKPSSTIFCDTSGYNIIEKVGRDKILRVGTTGDYAPFSYKTVSHESVSHKQQLETQDFIGVDIELAKNLAKTMGVDLQLVQTSWQTLMADLAAEKFDIAMSGISITHARKQHALFSTPVHNSGKVPITRSENAHKYQSIQDINTANVRVIVNQGGTNEIFTRKHFPKAQLILSHENLSVFQRIVDGDADVMVTDMVETLVQQAIHPELTAVNPDTPLNSFDKGYMMICDPKFKVLVDKWVYNRKQDGTLESVFNKQLNTLIGSTHQ